jgi:hypothetical protein
MLHYVEASNTAQSWNLGSLWMLECEAKRITRRTLVPYILKPPKRPYSILHGRLGNEYTDVEAKLLFILPVFYCIFTFVISVRQEYTRRVIIRCFLKQQQKSVKYVTSI